MFPHFCKRGLGRNKKWSFEQKLEKDIARRSCLEKSVQKTEILRLVLEDSQGSSLEELEERTNQPKPKKKETKNNQLNKKHAQVEK